MTCWHSINGFPSNVLVPGFPIPKPQDLLSISLRADELSEEVNQWFDQRGLRVLHAIYFMRTHRRPSNIHVDMFREGHDNCCSLNVMLGGEGIMEWYEPHEGVVPKNMVHTEWVFYRMWEPNQVRKIDECSVNGPTLVRTNVPHRARATKGHRVVVSIRFAKKDEQVLLDWEQAKQCLAKDM